MTKKRFPYREGLARGSQGFRSKVIELLTWAWSVKDTVDSVACHVTGRRPIAFVIWQRHDETTDKPLSCSIDDYLYDPVYNYVLADNYIRLSA